jgi:predicted metalloprotease with PDZ domain
MDSPTEISNFVLREWAEESAGGPARTMRFAIHYVGPEAQVDTLVDLTKRVVKEQEGIFGELPSFDYGTYTFEGDYLPWVNGDGMEHRNSTTLASRIPANAPLRNMIGTVSHEFFHSWNMERIRAKAIEPFDFERANISGELWLAEGFTQYFGPLTLSRTGLADLPTTLDTMADFVRAVALNPAHTVRSAEDMSRMATFTDGGRTVDRTNFSTTFISYYAYGGAVALALDLSLRGRSDGKVTLDDYMRSMWREHGKPGGSREGYVDRPYTLDDAEARLAEVSGDARFADDFFSRYISGRQMPDYAALFARAGLVLRKTSPGRAWWGELELELRSGGIRLAEAPAIGTPIYAAGLDAGDELKTIDGTRIASSEDAFGVLRRRRPGDTIPVVYADRAGTDRKTELVLGEDPRVELVTIESTGGVFTPEQRTFRQRWLKQ